MEPPTAPTAGPKRISKEDRQAKGRNRHAPHQTAALNDVFARTDHPSLQERIALGERLGMETKVVNSWFQNKRASLRKRAGRADRAVSRASTEAPTTALEDTRELDVEREPHRPSLPPISALLASRPSSRPPFFDDGSDYESDDDARSYALPPVQAVPPQRASFFSPPMDRPRLPELPPMRDLPPVTQRGLRLPEPHLSSRFHDVRRPLALEIPPYSRHARHSDDDGESAYSSNGPPSAQFASPARPAFFAPIVEGSRLTDMYKKRVDEDDEGSNRSSSGSASVHSQLRAAFFEPARDDVPPPHVQSALLSRGLQGRLPVEMDAESEADQGSVRWQPQVGYKMRRRPGLVQLSALKRLWDQTQNPSKEARSALADEIGMRYQSITNWFQNQRSQAKKRRLEDFDESDSAREQSLSPDGPGASPVEPISAMSMSRSAALLRTRRTRPEPAQLAALKALYARTQAPSIEERGALALEIGMELPRVTNWFRNLRQTAKKKRTRASGVEGERDGDHDHDHERDGEEDADMDMDMDAEDEGWSVSGGGSRAVSVSTFARDTTPAVGPLLISVTSSFADEVQRTARPSPVDDRTSEADHDAAPEDASMEIDEDVLHSHYHDHDTATDEDEQQEAVTPGGSPQPPASVEIRASSSSSSAAMDARPDGGRQGASSPEVERFGAFAGEMKKYPGVRVEDAVLLLSLRQPMTPC